MTAHRPPDHDTGHRGPDDALARTYCVDCAAARSIVETFSESVQERHGQRGVIVTRLTCGHEQVRDDGTFSRGL